jgi:hypothetical protein
MEDLRNPNFPRPAIVFFESAGTRFGDWHLVLYVADDHVGFLAGDAMVIKLVGLEAFRADWSGYALTMQKQGSFQRTVLRYGSFGVAALAVLSLAISLTRRQFAMAGGRITNDEERT